MELTEIQSLWQAYERKLEKTSKLNLHFIEMMQVQKVRSELAPLFRRRMFEIILHTAVIILLLGFLYNNFLNIRYALSGLLLLAFYLVAFTGSLNQIIILKRMDYSNDIITLQGSLIKLRTNVLNYARLVILCIPTFLAFPVVVSQAIKDFHWNAFAAFDIVALSKGSWWTAQLAATLSLLPLCIWFYLQVTYKNIHKKYVRDFIQKSSGTRVRKAIEFMNELELLKHDRQ